MWNNIFLYLGAFSLGFLMDWVYAKYVSYTAEKEPIKAANYSFLIYVFGILYTLMIIDKQFYMIGAYLIGGYLGTYYGVKKQA